MDTHELEQALRDPGAWPHGPASVELGRTHLSLLVFAGERVYKLKRPVDLGFVDFTDPERRRRACEDEVRLNRRLCPDVHQGVAPVVLDAQGRVRVREPGPPREGDRVLEWAVQMRRLPAEGMLDRALDRGEVDNALLRDLAALLAGFHAEAATGPGVDEHGTPDAVRALVRENFEQTLRFAGDPAAGAPLSPARHAFLSRRAEAFLDAERELLARRVREGRIRDGHGDLHAGNVCLEPGRISVYDCIEFAPRFRCGDVACDLAFLAMDLDSRGYPGFAGWLAQEYAARAGDGELERLMTFYKGYRAVVRAKVACFSSEDGARGADERAAKRAEAAAYFDLATGYELPPSLVLACGLPASGKSWLARRIARPLRALLHRSDVRRKQVTGLGAGARAGADWEAGIYSPGASDRTYRDLLEGAVRELEAGRSVVVDASFSRRARRRDWADAAERMGVPWCLVLVEADEALVRERLARRATDRREASDADLEVWRRAREVFEEPDELPPGRVLRVRSGERAGELDAARALDLLVAAAGG